MRRRNTKPSLRHEREPNTPLPIEGCHCDDCLNARDDQHGERIGNLLGFEKEPEAELTGDAATDALTDAYERMMQRRG